MAPFTVGSVGYTQALCRQQPSVGVKTNFSSMKMTINNNVVSCIWPGQVSHWIKKETFNETIAGHSIYKKGKTNNICVQFMTYTSVTNKKYPII